VLGIAAIIIAFIATVIGLVHSHRVTTDEQYIFGLSGTGVTLSALAVIALAFGIGKEIDTTNSAKALAVKQRVTDQMLKEIHASVLGAKEQASDQETKENLSLVLERITATASHARESDFSMSDFSRSNFAHGNFRQANFQGALFDGANLAGADLSQAYIDEYTKLPQ